MNTLNQNPDQVAGAFAVDVSRGERNGRVSSEWWNRPDDQRFLSLDDLYRSVKGRAEAATVRTVRSNAVQVTATREDTESLQLIVPGRDEPIVLCTLVGAPELLFGLSSKTWRRTPCAVGRHRCSH